MNVEIADILKSKIEHLNFVDQIAGAIRPVIKVDVIQDEDNQDIATVRKIFPVACNVSKQDCEDNGRYFDLVPNDKYRTLIYFEDRGVRIVNREGRLMTFRSTLRLVCWINLNKFATTNCSLSSQIAAIIIKNLPNTKFNSGDYQQITVGSISEVPKSPDIFASYSYLEETNQYLLYPFDYFALDIETDFSIRQDCIDDDSIDITPKTC